MATAAPGSRDGDFAGPTDGGKRLSQPKERERTSENGYDHREHRLDTRKDQHPERRQQQHPQEPDDTPRLPAADDSGRLLQRRGPIDVRLGQERAACDCDRNDPAHAQPVLEAACERVPAGAGSGAGVVLREHADLSDVREHLGA